MSAPDAGYPSVVPNVIHEHPTSSGGAGVAYVVYAALAGLAMGLVGGFVWSKVAEPPTAVIARNGGAYLTGELGYDQQSTVTLWFLVIGAGLGLLLGLVLASRGWRHGVTTVVAVLVSTAIASWLSAYLGIHVFGPDVQAQLASAQPGDLVTAPLTIGPKSADDSLWRAANVVYLGWPIGGLVGAIIAMTFWPTVDKAPAMPGWSSTVVPH